MPASASPTQPPSAWSGISARCLCNTVTRRSRSRDDTSNPCNCRSPAIDSGRRSTRTTTRSGSTTSRRSGASIRRWPTSTARRCDPPPRPPARARPPYGLGRDEAHHSRRVQEPDPRGSGEERSGGLAEPRGCACHPGRPATREHLVRAVTRPTREAHPRQQQSLAGRAPQHAPTGTTGVGPERTPWAPPQWRGARRDRGLGAGPLRGNGGRGPRVPRSVPRGRAAHRVGAQGESA